MTRKTWHRNGKGSRLVQTKAVRMDGREVKLAHEGRRRFSVYTGEALNAHVTLVRA